MRVYRHRNASRQRPTATWRSSFPLASLNVSQRIETISGSTGRLRRRAGLIPARRRLCGGQQPDAHDVCARAALKAFGGPDPPRPSARTRFCTACVHPDTQRIFESNYYPSFSLDSAPPQMAGPFS